MKPLRPLKLDLTPVGGRSDPNLERKDSHMANHATTTERQAATQQRADQQQAGNGQADQQPPLRQLVAAIQAAREATLDFHELAAAIWQAGPKADTQELRGDAVSAQQQIRDAQEQIRELAGQGVAAMMPVGMMSDGWMADLLGTLDKLTAWNANEVWRWGKVRTGTGDELTPANLPEFLEGQAKSLTATMTALMNVASMVAVAGDNHPAATSQSAKRRRTNRVKLATERPLTAVQAETVHVVGEHRGNISAAAKQLGKDAATVRECYKTAMKKLGRTATKHKTQAMGHDQRGQPDIATDDDRRLN